jgi:hypothetical protein
MKTVFLGGPIRHLERESALKWRLKAMKLLGNDFNVINPLRGREKGGTFPFLKGIVARDKYDIDHSDILLVNDELEDIAMIGTSMEIMYAFERGLIIALFGNGHKGNLFLEEHSHMRFDALEDASEFLIKMFK